VTYFLDLFAGIGGFALGAYWAGLRFDRHYFSEVDDYAIRVYQQRFPDAEPLGDIRAIRGADLTAGDWIIAGGFPCQDISVAGKGAGLAGERSGLWYEYARLIGELRPRFAIMENVGALAFRGLDAVLGSLAALGYDAEWQDIRASDVGAPHRRERLWIVAYPDAMHSAGSAEPREQLERAAQPGRSGEDGMEAGTDVAYPSSKGFQVGRQSQWPEGNAKAKAGMESESERCGEAMADSPNGGDVRRYGELESAQGQVREHRGSPQNGSWEWWAVEPDVGRVAHGIPARVDRLKCLGNSIVPQIAEMIFAGIGDSVSSP
jgi:DNA (cytosine-5)-methyltransferase 1